MHGFTPFHDPRCLIGHPQQNFQRQMTCQETTGTTTNQKHRKYVYLEEYNRKKQADIHESTKLEIFLAPEHREQQHCDPQIYGWVIQLVQK
jgi:hypothetical protein